MLLFLCLMMENSQVFCPSFDAIFVSGFPLSPNCIIWFAVLLAVLVFSSGQEISEIYCPFQITVLLYATSPSFAGNLSSLIFLNNLVHLSHAATPLKIFSALPDNMMCWGIHCSHKKQVCRILDGPAAIIIATTTWLMMLAAISVAKIMLTISL